LPSRRRNIISGIDAAASLTRQHPARHALILTRLLRLDRDRAACVARWYRGGVVAHLLLKRGSIILRQLRTAAAIRSTSRRRGIAASARMANLYMLASPSRCARRVAGRTACLARQRGAVRLARTRAGTAGRAT